MCVCGGWVVVFNVVCSSHSIIIMINSSRSSSSSSSSSSSRVGRGGQGGLGCHIAGNHHQHRAKRRLPRLGSLSNYSVSDKFLMPSSWVCVRKPCVFVCGMHL